MDRDFIEALAADMISYFGQAVLERLNESKRIAAGQGDRLSVKAWQEVVDTAKRMLAAKGTPERRVRVLTRLGSFGRGADHVHAPARPLSLTGLSRRLDQTPVPRRRVLRAIGCNTRMPRRG
jgi:hypothetical protein